MKYLFLPLKDNVSIFIEMIFHTNICLDRRGFNHPIRVPLGRITVIGIIKLIGQPNRYLFDGIVLNC